MSLGLPPPEEQSSLVILRRVQAGIKRVHSFNVTQKIRLPITPQVLYLIKHGLESTENPNSLAVWAICCVAFFGFFRMGELLPESERSFNQASHLSWGDVAVDDRLSPTMVRVHLKRSKCDQFGEGVDVIVGRTNNSLCPVTAMLAYMASRGVAPGPFFLSHERKVITKSHFVTVIRSVLEAEGLPQNQYAGHSFRIGAATAAAQAGIADSAIQMLGRWHSAAFLQYIRAPRDQLASLSAPLSRVGHPASTVPVRPEHPQDGSTPPLAADSP